MHKVLFTCTDLARLCGEDGLNVTRLRNSMMKLNIYGYNTIGDFTCGDGKAICVNPKVFYAGNDLQDVNRLYVLFEMCQKKR